MNGKVLLLFAGLILAPIVADGQTTTFYFCNGNDGVTSLQKHPCSNKAQTKSVHVIPSSSNQPDREQRVTLYFTHVKLSDVIKVLAYSGNVDIRLNPRVDRFVFIYVVNKPWDQVLNGLLAQYNLHFVVIKGVGYVY